jgi:hypothetical protein
MHRDRVPAGFPEREANQFDNRRLVFYNENGGFIGGHDFSLPRPV